MFANELGAERGNGILRLIDRTAKTSQLCCEKLIWLAPNVVASLVEIVGSFFSSETLAILL